MNLRDSFHVGATTRSVSFDQIEFRASGDSSHKVAGYAALFDSPTTIRDWMGDFQETIKPGAFTKTLKDGADVRFLINHDGLPLARTKSGTLKLSEDSKGLHMEAELDHRNSLASDLANSIERGDLDQMSFAFEPVRQAWTKDYTERDIIEAKLFDVSAVTYPAYSDTSIDLRDFALRTVGAKALARMERDIRDGSELSKESLAILRQVLQLVAAADNAVDVAQPLLAEVLGVENPDIDDDDDDDDGTSSSSRSMPIAAARAIIEIAKNF